MDLKTILVLGIASVISCILAFMILEIKQIRPRQRCVYDLWFGIIFVTSLCFTCLLYIAKRASTDTIDYVLILGCISILYGMCVSVSVHWVCGIYDQNVLFMDVDVVSGKTWQTHTIRGCCTHVAVAFCFGLLGVICAENL